MSAQPTTKGGSYRSACHETLTRQNSQHQAYLRRTTVPWRGFRVAIRYAPERCFHGGSFLMKMTGWRWGAPMALDRVDLQESRFGFRVKAP